MPPLDIPTLLILLGAIIAFAGATLFLLWRENRDLPGLLCFVFSFGAAALAGGLTASLDTLPPFLSVLLADIFITLSIAGIVEGLRRFYGFAPKTLWIGYMALLVAAVSAWWTWGSPNLPARSYFTLSLMMIYGGAAAWVIWRGGRRKETRVGSWLLLFAAGLFIVTVLGQFFLLIQRPPTGLAVSGWLVIGLILSLLAGLLGLFMTISGLHLASAEALRREAEKSERSKAGFLAVMSHEIRTPMNGVLGLTEILLKEDLTPQQSQLALSVRSSGRILLRILDDVLDLSKIEAGRMEIERVGFKIRDLVEEVRQLVREPAARKHLSFGTDIAAEVPIGVVGDPARLGQVLLNLLGNAVKFTEQGTVTLRLSQSSGGHILFQVIDTGIGMAPEGLGRLFDAFEQMESSTSRRFGGTGLGLAISKHLVELMGGSIEVESAPGRGSTFSVLLPMVHQDGDTPETDEISLREVFFDEIRPGRGIGEKQDARALRILVAEDDPVSQIVAEGMLEGLGLSCDVVSDGAAALEAVEARDYDLVFMDCQMPQLDGFEATRRIRVMKSHEDGPRLPIIALTAGVMGMEKEYCYEVGMDDVVTKPVSTRELADVIGRWLHVDLS